LLFLSILTLFWALFSLTLPWDPNGEGQQKKHLLPARRRRLLWSFLLYSITVYMNVESCLFSAYKIWLPLSMLVVCMLSENFFWIDFLVCPNTR
jgi:hypothetical protein